MKTALFRSDRQRRRGSKELVHVPACPSCDGPLEEVTSAMPALFRHGGHGATRTVTQRFCAPCRYAGGSVVVETNPRRDA